MKQSLKSVLRKILFAVAPRLMSAVTSARERALSQELAGKWGLCEINRRLIRELGNRVVSGPFRGMVLTPMTHAEHIGPYLLGTYEAELQPWWDAVLGGSFAQVVDVGAKFGYYAVGLARRFPAASVVAFDTDWWARSALAEMIRANDVGNVRVKAFCSPAWWRRSLVPNALIISDCEGYERELFCNAEASLFRDATLIIETHDEIAPGVSSDLMRRFAPTHEVASIWSRQDPALPAVRVQSLTQEELCRAGLEIRPRQEWLMFTPKRNGTTIGGGRADRLSPVR